LKPRADNRGAMRLRAWGILLLLVGVLLVAAAAVSVQQARAWQKEGEAACAAGDDASCGTGRTYVLALAIALLPSVTLPASLLVILGAVLWGLDVAMRQRREAAPPGSSRGSVPKFQRRMQEKRRFCPFCIAVCQFRNRASSRQTIK
jgi:hypothetical protein